MKKPSPPNNSTTKSSDSDRILIKKYPNRRLYNTSTSAYIVLDDIVELVRANTSFVIEDAKSGEDITRTILNQIIFERETKPSNFHFPLEFQKQLIGMYGDTYGQMVPDYLTESLNLFAAERSKINNAFENVVDRNTQAMMDYSQKLAQQNMELFKRSWSMFGMMTKSPSSAEQEDDAAPTEPEPQEKASELEEIQNQINALQERLKSLK